MTHSISLKAAYDRFANSQFENHTFSISKTNCRSTCPHECVHCYTTRRASNGGLGGRKYRVWKLIIHAISCHSMPPFTHSHVPTPIHHQSSWSICHMLRYRHDIVPARAHSEDPTNGGDAVECSKLTEMRTCDRPCLHKRSFHMSTWVRALLYDQTCVEWRAWRSKI
jgi:hypothetical protein